MTFNLPLPSRSFNLSKSSDVVRGFAKIKIEEIKILFKKAEFYDLIEPDKHETELITILRKYKDKITVKEAINIIEKKIRRQLVVPEKVSACCFPIFKYQFYKSS